MKILYTPLLSKSLMLLLYIIALVSCKKNDSNHIDKNKTLISVDYWVDTIPDSIVLTDVEYKNWHSFKNGEAIKAEFPKAVPHIYIIAFFIKGKHYTKDFWLNNGNPELKVSLKNNEVLVDTVLNASLYYEYSSFFKELDYFDKTQDSTARDKFMIDKIDEHFNDCFSNLVAANYMIYHQNNHYKLIKLYDKIKHQNDGIKYGYMSDYATLEKWLGRQKINLFSYNLINTKGVKAKPDHDNDKLYLIDFWFVNCPPCVADHKIIDSRLDDFTAKGIDIIGISRDEEYNKWINYLKLHNYTWNNYKQAYDEKHIPADDLGITAYPTYIVVNSRGEIVSKRYNAIQDVVADYLDTPHKK